MLRLVSSLFLLILAFSGHAEDGADYYRLGSQVSEAVELQSRDGQTHSLTKLISKAGKKVNVIFIFGGGGMGHESTELTGGLWCPDSFEDMHILRSINNQYADQVGVFPVAVPPVFHTKMMGFTERVLLDVGASGELGQAARKAFVDSTQNAFKRGTIPVQPLFDTDFNFLISRDQIELRKPAYPAQDWHGAFRAVDEQQHYGVPNLWLVDAQGAVLTEPFRGNVYRPHGTPIVIKYTLQDVITAIEAQL